MTFDMENPRHRDAFALFSAQSGRLRSEYVVECILKTDQDNRLEDTMRKVITEALKDVQLTAPATKRVTAESQATQRLSDLPDALLASLDEI